MAFIRQHISSLFLSSFLMLSALGLLIHGLPVENVKQANCDYSANTYWCAKLGPCIPRSQVCDGQVDCPNGRDEMRCAATTTEVATTPSATTVATTEAATTEAATTEAANTEAATIEASTTEATTTEDATTDTTTEAATTEAATTEAATTEAATTEAATTEATTTEATTTEATTTEATTTEAATTEAATTEATTTEDATTGAATTIDPLWSCMLEENSFHCSEAGPCIPDYWVCDGVVDCDTGRDEQSCQPSTTTAAPETTTMEVVSSTVAETTVDPLWSCMLEENSFHCSEAGPCIPDYWVCDGVVDCDTGKDEHSCNLRN